MNNDSDNIRNLLLWLLQDCDPTFSPPSGNGSTSEADLETPVPKASLFEVGSDATSVKPAHAGSEGTLSQPSTFSRARPSKAPGHASVAARDSVSQTAQSFNFGEIHAVQERFQYLLKQRLRLEYESKPPLFPWESEVGEYPAEIADRAPVGPSSLWSDYVSTLKVPGLLPEALLNKLFERCQDMAQTPMKQGVRLVRAVEELFPEQLNLLEPVANLVLVPAYRSDRSNQAAVIQELTNVAGGYDSALPEQQIALSMLAAQEILGALTFAISLERPQAARNWVTSRGVLTLTVTYAANQLAVAAVLPDGGQLRLWDGDVEQRAMRSGPGGLDIVWANPALGKTYVLEVSLKDEAKPLNMAVQLAEQ